MLDLLFVHWHVDPVLFHIGSLGIRWYSLLFVSGFIIGWYIFRGFFRREGISEDLLDPLLYTLLIGTIVGARLGHCLFYQPDYYLGSWQGFLEIFMPWKGGLASHGGAIALLLAMWWYARHYGRKNDFDFLWIMDHLCITVAFAGCLIRLGNLFNSEIYGDVTSLPWGFRFIDNVGAFMHGAEPIFTVPCHPTQLYEATCYLVTFAVCMWLYWKRNAQEREGLILGVFMLGIFGSRFLVEYVKNVQVEWEIAMRSTWGVDQGQLLSIPFILLGLWLVIRAMRRPRVPINFPNKFADDKK